MIIFQTYNIKGNYKHIMDIGKRTFFDIDELLERVKHLNGAFEQVIEYINDLLKTNKTVIGDYEIELVKGEIRETKKRAK